MASANRLRSRLPLLIKTSKRHLIRLEPIFTTIAIQPFTTEVIVHPIELVPAINSFYAFQAINITRINSKSIVLGVGNIVLLLW